MKQALIQSIMLSSGLLHGVACFLAVGLQVPTNGFLLLLPLTFGLTNVVMGIRGPVADRWVLGFIALHLVELVVFLFALGWAPVVALYVLFCSLAVVIRFGKQGVMAFIVFLALLLVGGGGLVSMGWFTPAESGNAADPMGWYRVAILHACLTLGITLSIDHMMGKIWAAEVEGRAIQQQLQEQRHRLEAMRTSRAQAECRVRDAQKALTLAHLASGLSHRIGNTFTVIGAAREGLRRARDVTEVRYWATAVEESVQHSATIIHDILAFSRRTPPVPQSVRIEDELKDLEGLLRQTVPEDLTLSIVLEAVPAVMA